MRLVATLCPCLSPLATLPHSLAVSPSHCFPFSVCGTFLATANYRQHISSHLALPVYPSHTASLLRCLSHFATVKIACLGIGHYRGKASISDGAGNTANLQLWQHNCKLHWAIAWPITVLAWKMEQPATRNCQN